MHLSEFVNLPIKMATVSNRMWVEFKGFDDLYVRHGGFCVNSEWMKNTIQIANVTATNPGNGAFKKLVAYLQKNFSELVIIVECVNSKQFATGLLKMGFTEFKNGSTSHFLK